MASALSLSIDNYTVKRCFLETRQSTVVVMKFKIKLEV